MEELGKAEAVSVLPSSPERVPASAVPMKQAWVGLARMEAAAVVVEAWRVVMAWSECDGGNACRSSCSAGC